MDSKCRIQVFGGMSKGLPLANAVQSGLLMDGTIQQAWGIGKEPNRTSTS